MIDLGECEPYPLNLNECRQSGTGSRNIVTVGLPMDGKKEQVKAISQSETFGKLLTASRIPQLSQMSLSERFLRS